MNYIDKNGNVAIALGLYIGYIIAGAALSAGISIAAQLIENKGKFEEIDWIVVTVEALFGALDGFLSVSGLSGGFSAVLNIIISGMQTVIMAGLSGETVTGGEVLVSMILSGLFMMIPNTGVSANKMEYIYSNASSKLKTAKKASKIAQYQLDQKFVKKSILKNSIGYVSAKIGTSAVSYGVDEAFWKYGIY